MPKRKRNIGLEILAGIREIKRGEHGRVINFPMVALSTFLRCQPFEKVPVFRSLGSHSFLVCRCEHSKNGSKAVAPHQELRALC